MSKKNKAREEFMEVDYWGQLSEEEKQYMRKFHNEYYDGSPGRGDDPVITSPEMIKEAYRMNNQLFRDAFSVIKNTDAREYSENDLDLIQQADDTISWQDAYKQFGPDLATELIFRQAERDIESGQDIKICLARAISKYEALKRTVRKEKRNEKKKA